MKQKKQDDGVMGLAPYFLAAVALLIVSYLFAAVAPPKAKGGEFAVSPGFRVSAGESPRESVKGADPSASTVFVSWGGNGGTGTVVACESGKSLILTCAHVAPSAGPVKVIHEHKEYAARFVAAGPQVQGGRHEPDLCLLVVDAELPAVTLADDPAKLGDRLRQWGFGGRRYPLSDPPTDKSGKVVPRTLPPGYIPSGDDLLSTLPCESGDSGSGVFNDRGELVGVTWSSTPSIQQWVNGRLVWVPDPQVRHGAVPLAKVKAFVKAHAARLFPRLAARLAGKKGDEPKKDEKTPPKFDVKPMPKAEAPKAAPPAPAWEFLGYDRHGRPVFRQCLPGKR